MKLNSEQRDILHHTIHRAAGGFYCGDSPDMKALVAAGLMVSAGRKSFVPDEYFRITSAGREALKASEAGSVGRGTENHLAAPSKPEETFPPALPQITGEAT